jgi:hypothetical protein
MMRTPTRLARAGLLAGLAGCATGCAGVAARVPAPPHHFLERSYVFKTRGDTSYVYEAQAAAHLFLLDGLPLAYDRLRRTDTATHAPTRNVTALRVAVSPVFRIRQLRDSSAAVRTPSFSPRILAVEGLVAKRLGTVTVLGDNVRFRELLLSGLRVSLTHHSNGQAGCFRAGYRPVDPRHAYPCEPAPVTDPTLVLPRDTLPVRLNLADGDFSTTFASILAHTTYLGDLTGDVPHYRAGGAVGFDWHPKGIVGALTEEQRLLYGSWRVRGQGELLWVSGLTCADDDGPRSARRRVACALRGRTRLSAEGERGPRSRGPLAERIAPAIVPWRGSVEVSHAFDWLLGAGVFVRRHDGQDYYNIGFVNRHHVLAYGLMLDVGGLDLIRKRDASNP